MATRSMVARKNTDTLDCWEYNGVYVHWDGSPSTRMPLLEGHYTDNQKIDDLIALGSISALKENLSPAEGVEHSFDSPAEGVTIAYHRDRNEELNIFGGSRTQLFNTAKASCCEWVYIWEDGEWSPYRA